MTPRKEVLADGVEIWLGDCLEVLQEIPACFRINAVVTSPPYDGLRDYGGHNSVDTMAVIERVSTILSAGGVCVWNVADGVVDGSETGTSFRQALKAIDCGMRLHYTMIYCKEGVTFPDNNRYHPAFEYMFVFSNGAPAHFNGIRDWKNKWAGSAMHGTDRLSDGSTKPINGMGRIVPQMGLRRNWWIIPNAYTGETAGHPAPMPFRLASDHIETWTVKGETVMDPFLGSGTTGVAAVRLGRKFVGMEIEEKYFDIARQRISEALRQPDLLNTA